MKENSFSVYKQNRTQKDAPFSTLSSFAASMNYEMECQTWLNILNPS